MNSANATPQDQGYILLRSEVRFVEANRVHLEGRREFEVTAADRLLIDLVQAGVGDVELLVRTLRELTGAEVSAEALCASVRNPRSILELVPRQNIIEPDVIVCCFGVGASEGWVAPFVQRLRKRARVLVIGRDESVRGPFHQNAAFKSSQRLKLHANWYQFLQWARATVRRFEDKVLVLASPIDAVLFGDLVPYLKTVIKADRHWPTQAGIGDMFGPDWLPEALGDERRELHYALRVTQPQDLEKLTRLSGSTFALLEAHALRFASLVVPTTTFHRAELLSLGQAPEVIRLAQVVTSGETASETSPEEAPRDLLVVGIGPQRTLDAIGPLLQMLLSVPPEKRPFQIVALRAEEGWLRVDLEGEMMTLRHWAGRPPEPERILASLQVVGLQRHLEPIYEALAWPAPCWIVPSVAPHPILAFIPEQMRLGAGEPLPILERLWATAPQDSAHRSQALALQRELLERLDLVGMVFELVKAQPSFSAADATQEVQQS
jgi:hypothetical protein